MSAFLETPFPSFFIAMTLYGIDYPFGQFESVVVMSSPNFWHTLDLLTVGEKERALKLREHCLATAKIVVCLRHKSKM